jgi:hypothetical protein
MNRIRLGDALRSRTTSGTLLAAATATVVIAAVTVTGVPVSHVSANDGGVWLVNDSLPDNFGELNVPIRQLSLTIPASTTPQTGKLDVRQSGTTVIAIDDLAHRVYPIDVATGAADTSGGVSFTGSGQVALGGGVAALLEPGTLGTRGQLWVTGVGATQTPSLSGLAGADHKPVTTLPDAEAVAVDTAGDVYVASPTQLLTLQATSAGLGPARVSKLAQPLTQGAVSLTTVGTTPVVMNTSPSDPVLLFPDSGRSTPLPPRAATGAATEFALQQPGPAASDVLVASPTELIGVPLGGGSYRDLATLPGGGGTPFAQPVEFDRCAYGAWAGSPGTVVQTCAGAAPLTSTLTSKATGGPATLIAPVFRENNDELILNDTANGDAWTVVGRPAPVLDSQDWQRVIKAETTRASKTPGISAPQPNQHPAPPVLKNPTLYARAGVDSTLHVLDDDSDPGGRILSILSVTLSGPGFTAHVAPDTQTVVLSLLAGQHIPITFDYTVIDGFGLTKSGSVQVDPTTSETPPFLPKRTPTLKGDVVFSTSHVVSSTTVSMQVLGDWRDAENDPLALGDASVPAGEGQVTWTSDGLISYTAPSEDTDTHVTVTYHVTDGRSAPVGSQLHLVVLGRGDLTAYPPYAQPNALRVTVGRPATFDPLANNVFGADPLQPQAKLALAGPVAGVAGITVATNTNTGTLTLTASQSGVYSLHYQATFGSAESPSTQILVYAVEPNGSARPPVTSPVSVVLHGQYAATVDVLDADYDPDGGLLSVVGVDAASDLQATVEDGEYLRLVATTPQPPPTQIVTYEVSNGITYPVPGQVTVDWEPALAPTPPVVPSTYATVRAGDEADIPVLASASDPDGESVHLLDGGTPAAVAIAPTNPGPAYPTGLGSASISGGYLRYSGPPQGTVPMTVAGPEAVTVSYVVESQSGERTTGQTYVTIEPDTPSLDSTPAPGEVDARASSGGTITIPIPTTGITADGDSVTVTGITSAPTLGRVMGLTANSITYQAYPVAPGSGTFTGGTDTFSYQVEGPSGLTAQAIIRVCVTPPLQAQTPVAVDHYVTAAPGQTIDVDLLSGDIISLGDVVTVEPLNTTNETLPAGTSLLSGGTLQVVAPSSPAARIVAFGITDGTAPPSVAHVIVRDEPSFVIPPVAADYYPTAPAAGVKSLTVDVLAKDSDPTGPAISLRVVGSPTSGVLVAGVDLDIPASPYPRSVPYEIKSTTTGATAVGVVHVLGQAVGPQLIAGKEIRVPEGGTTTVNIGDYITDSTHPIRLTETSQVSASPSGGLSEQVDSNTTLTLRGAAGYVGPGSLTVQVIDAPTLSAPGARIATFSIPVQVGNPTPVIRCPSTPLRVVESGPPVDVNIAGVCQVWTPDGASPTTLTYTESWSRSVPGVSLGWQRGQAGHVIAVSAASSATGGSVGAITVGVAGAGSTADSALEVQAVEAPPAAVSAIDIPGVQTGATTKIDMAQYVTSPLAQPQITVISVGRPSRGNAQVSFSGAQVDILVGKGVHATVSFSVLVSDQGAARHDRYVNGIITLQVLDVPGAPTGIQGIPGNGEVQLTWLAAPDDGAPVEYYDVTAVGIGTQKTTGTSLTWTGLKNGQNYTFTIVAYNQVGPGPSSTPAIGEPNSVPGAPTNVTAIGGNMTALVTWTAPFNGGKTIDDYIVSSPGLGTVDVPGSHTSYTWPGLNNSGGPYQFTIVAHNADGVGPASPESSAVRAHGRPAAPLLPPMASGKVAPDQRSTAITVTWGETTDCNDGQPCASYTITEFSQGVATGSTATVTGGQCLASTLTCSASFEHINSGAGYTYTYTDTNGFEGDPPSPASPASAPPVYAAGHPDQIQDATVVPSNYQGGGQQLTVTFTIPVSNASGISEVDFEADGSTGNVSGSWQSPGASGQTVNEPISSLTNGTAYTVTVWACSENSSGTTVGCNTTPSSPATCPAGTPTDCNVPYGPPTEPTITTNWSNDSFVFNWNDSTNGRSLQYHVCIGGSCSIYNSPASSASYSCTAGVTATAYVVDTNGDTSPTATDSMAACSVSVSQGGRQNTSYCTVQYCDAVVVNGYNFAPSATYTIWYSTDCQTWISGGVQKCGTTNNYVSESVPTDGSGHFSSSDRSFGWPGAHVWINAGAQYPGGVQSNTIQWTPASG